MPPTHPHNHCITQHTILLSIPNGALAKCSPFQLSRHLWRELILHTLLNPVRLLPPQSFKLGIKEEPERTLKLKFDREELLVTVLQYVDGSNVAPDKVMKKFTMSPSQMGPWIITPTSMELSEAADKPSVAKMKEVCSWLQNEIARAPELFA